MAKGPVVVLVGVAEQAAASLQAYLGRVGFDLRGSLLSWHDAMAAFPAHADIAVLGEDVRPPEATEMLLRHAHGQTLFLVLCGRAALVERVLMLESGAADVVEAPIHPRELAARLASLAVRRGFSARETLMLERSTVDLKAALVMLRGGEEEQLSPGQLALLRLFIANPHKVLTREDIMAAAPAGREETFDRSIDSRIVRLRRKLDTDSISTIRGAGYRFEPPM